MTTLRAPEPSDLDFLYRLEYQPDIWRVTWGDGPVSRHMLWDYLQHYTADIYRDRQLRWIIEQDGNPVGTIDLTDFDPNNSRAMIGVAISAEHRQQGVATDALSKAIEFCGRELGLHQLAAIVARDNECSLKLFRNAGFSTSGCLRSWIKKGNTYSDAIIFQLML